MVLESDQEVVNKVNAYFNNLTDLQGVFIQTDPDSKQRHGKFFFQRPGKARFDYAPPSGLRIISDGRNLVIEDHAVNTSERYPLDVTPFKLLLSDKVDLGTTPTFSASSRDRICSFSRLRRRTPMVRAAFACSSTRRIRL